MSNNIDVLCIQETWLSKQDLDSLNSIHPNYFGIGESTTDLRDKLVRGRIAGGVAILWHAQHDTAITNLRLGVDWAIAIELRTSDQHFVIINVYLPFESAENDPVYRDRLAFLGAFIEELHTTSVYITGDFNADITNAQSTFARHLNDFCSDHNLIFSSKLRLPPDSYTYISEAWNSSSWLDHVITSADAHNCITDFSIEYNLSCTDHIPLCCTINIDALPVLTARSNVLRPHRIDWSSLSIAAQSQYCYDSGYLLSQVPTPRDALLCVDAECSDPTHKNDLCDYYSAVLQCLSTAADSLPRRVTNYSRPGWNAHVDELHSSARDAFLDWRSFGSNRQGPLYDRMKTSRAQFKYALRFIKRNEQAMRADSLAMKLADHNDRDFWREVKMLSNCKTPLPNNIDGAVGVENVCELWRKHYYSLFNCIHSNEDYTYPRVDFDNRLKVSPAEVRLAIHKLVDNKSCGPDNISAEHLKHADACIIPMLAMCFSSFFSHGFLPESMISVIIVPVIKDKAGKISSRDNYRPIALASVMSKIIERILLHRMEDFLVTTDNQFGFKPKHGTDMCIYALKEIVHSYNAANSTVFLSFLDASKAFDRINHIKLFNKLSRRGTPPYIIRILMFWYSQQTMHVRWGDKLSASFNVTNGVRQGGILSPYLFNVYMDELSQHLSNCHTGCSIGNRLVNHFMYADDLVIFSPYSRGLQKLLDICSLYGSDYDIKYNAKKSNVMVICSRANKQSVFPDFILCKEKLSTCKETKYLGHYISDDLSDDLDVNRQIRKLYIQGNTLARKFSTCTPDTKCVLFRTHCSSLYVPQLWCKYKLSSMRKLHVAYNDCLRILLRIPRYLSATQMFTDLNLQGPKAVLRNYMFKFMNRILVSDNVFLAGIVQFVPHPLSPFWRHWEVFLRT